MSEQLDGAVETGKLVAEESAFAGLVACTVVNPHSYTVRVVIMAHRNHELDERRVLLGPGQSATVPCHTGQVVFLVFNVDTDTFVKGNVFTVSGKFTYTA